MEWNGGERESGEKLTYNASGGCLWNQIDPRQAGVAQRRSGTTGTARASLTWQPSAKDVVQFNVNFSSPQLIAQGHRQSSGQVNVGCRRKIDQRLSLTFTGQNILDTMRQETVIDTPILRDLIRQKGRGRSCTSISKTLRSFDSEVKVIARVPGAD